MSLITDNIRAVTTQLEPYKAKLVAVTKNQSVATIREAMAAGLSVLGENRVQEALSKTAELADASPEWHLIGHLQTNKVRQALPHFFLIHSVDSERLALEISKEAARIQKVQDVLIQVNIADEESKFGIEPQNVMALAQSIDQMPNIRLLGLMTIAPFYDDAEKTRPVFRCLAELFKKLSEAKLKNAEMKWLSMGMTHDYGVALQEGANLVRIGTGIFGARG